MIIAENVNMKYPLPKKLSEYITKPFNTSYFSAIKNINISIEDGDKVAFLGVNGAGKTTLLKIIGGLIYPSSGDVKINGFNVVDQNLKARKNIGFVLNEERSFYWRLSGKENLEFFGALDNSFGNELEEKVNELLKLVGLENAKDKLFAAYSSGMKQRLAIARGLISDPSVLILDEPTRTLDPISVDEILGIIKNRIHEKKNRTLLIATHCLTEAKMLCNKFCLMKDGQIIIYSSIESIIQEYGSLSDCYKLLV